MAIYGKFTKNPTLHRLGHGVISLAVGLAGAYLMGWVPLRAFVTACIVLPLLLEAIDTYCGGLLVTWEERKRIFANAKARGFTFSRDSLNDLLDYQLGWLGFVAVILWRWVAG